MRLLWVDLETSGLEPREDRLLEAGLLVSDSELREEAATSLVISCPDADRLPMHEGVRAMHQASGLLEEARLSRLTTAEAEQHLLGWVYRHGADGLWMAGSGVGAFDRPWLKVHMPQLARVWHHRTLDATTVRLLCAVPKGEQAHRALPDMRRDLALVRGAVLRYHLPFPLRQDAEVVGASASA